MFDSAKLRVFRLSEQPGENGIRCEVNGLYVDHIPLLRVSCEASGRRTFQLRPLADINNALSLRYGLPIDFSDRLGGLRLIAGALEGGEVALAQIAALHLRLPDPPPLAKSLSDEEWLELALQLFWSGLLKGEWDPSKHPRTGVPPNPGWFAEVPKGPEPPVPDGAPREVESNASVTVAEMPRSGAPAPTILSLGLGRDTTEGPGVTTEAPTAIGGSGSSTSSLVYQTPVLVSSQTVSGIASYYNLPGQMMANRHVFNPNAMNAAMLHIPLGTVVTVQLATDPTRSISVTITDRGPYVPGRVIDLTPAAFTALVGSTKRGLARVIVTIP